MNLNTLAFFTGLFGSVHCVAMCGPLVMALPQSSQSVFFAFLQRILYQLGRILVYVFFGIIFGTLGKSFNLLGLQQSISIVTGIVLIMLAFSHFSRTKIAAFERFQLRLIHPIAGLMGRLLTKPYGGFLSGMLNGFLPCGMVYLAVAGAINSGSAIGGGEFMFFFGLGTTPLMLIASLGAIYLRKWGRLSLSRWLPYLTFIMGIWFILRGSQLDIPYLSPLIEATAPAVCH